MFYILGKQAATAQAFKSIGQAAGNVAQAAKPIVNTATKSLATAAPAQVQNVLPAKSLGGATQSGVKQLYQSTAGKGLQWP